MPITSVRSAAEENNVAAPSALSAITTTPIAIRPVLRRAAGLAAGCLVDGATPRGAAPLDTEPFLGAERVAVDIVILRVGR
jgi:hypothetical protein